MTDMTISNVLEQIQNRSLEISSKSIGGSNESQPSVSFGDLLQQSIDGVNDLQKTSASMAEAFEKGETDATLAEVMLAQQKSSIAFQSIVQVRNKLVDAYKDVMNMPM